MIKRLCSVLLPLTSLYSFAQIEYGATLGLNTSRFTNGIEALSGSFLNFNSVGLSLGGYAEYDITERIGLYSKLLYNEIGDREKNSVENTLSASQIDYKLNYISLPINVKFFKKVYIHLGPQLNVLLNYEAVGVELGDLMSSIDFGGNIGFGYKFNKLRCEINFYQGLSNLFELKNVGPSGTDLEARNMYFNLNVSYRIR